MQLHPGYVFEMPIQGENGKVVLDGDDGDENVGMGECLALFPE